MPFCRTVSTSHRTHVVAVSLVAFRWEPPFGDGNKHVEKYNAGQTGSCKQDCNHPITIGPSRSFQEIDTLKSYLGVARSC